MRVQALAELLGNLTWVILGIIAASILGWRFSITSATPMTPKTKNATSPRKAKLVKRRHNPQKI